MPKKMPQPLGGVVAVAKLALKLGLIPDPHKVLEQTQEERWNKRVPALLNKSGPRSVLTEDVVVSGRDGNAIPARVYTRPGTAPGAPAFLFIHGGGFIDGGIDFCDNVQRGLAERTGWVVVGLSYRLAPQHPFPAALHDCADVLQWMHDARPAGMDPDRIAVGGESAGGNLTAALCVFARDEGGPRIAHQTVYYPFADTSLTSPDWDSGLMPPVNRESGELMVRVYGGDDPHNPLINIVGADLDGVPPATVITCGHDVLMTDGLRFVAALKAAGVPTLHTHHDDMPHGFLMFNRVSSRPDESIDEMAREAGKQLTAARS